MLAKSKLGLKRSRTSACQPICALRTKVATKAANKTRLRSQKLAQQDSDSSSISALQYLLTTGITAATGLALTAAPQNVLELFGGQDVVNVTLTSTQVYGAYWLLVATATYRLSKAAEQDNLSSATYQRLNAFLALFTAASAVPFLQGIADGEFSTAPAAAAAAVLLAAAATTYAPGYLTNSGTTDIAEAAAGFGNALKGTFKAGRGLIGAFYSLSFWESFILGIALLGGPILPTVAGDINGSTLLVKDLVGVGTLLYSGLIWMLLDAVDRNRLGASTFRALNAACGGVSVLVGAVCVLGQANGIETNLTNQAVVLVSCLLTAAVYGYQAVKPSSNE